MDIKMESKARDAFFTKPEIAQRFVNKVNDLYPLWSFDNVIEPSAGEGSILQYLPDHNRIGLDIHPMNDEVLPGDFFDYEFPKGSTACVSNPPFGRQSKIAIQFFNRMSEYSDVIGIITPRSWLKYRTQKQLNPEMNLYWYSILPDNAFTLDGKPYTVRCCAMIWAKYPPQSNESEDFEINKQIETWNDKVSSSMLKDIYEYQLKHNCYEKPETLL